MDEFKSKIMIEMYKYSFTALDMIQYDVYCEIDKDVRSYIFDIIINTSCIKSEAVK